MTWQEKYLTWSFFWVVMIQWVGFKISWMLTAWGAVEGGAWSYWGALPFFAFLGLHVIYHKQLWELKYALTIGLCGSIIDTVYNSTGLIDYNGTYPVLDFLAPLWITSLWAGLAITLDHSLKMLIGRPVWTFLMGAVFGPLAYWTGKDLGAIRFKYDDWTMMSIMAVPWGLAFVACFWLLEYWRPKVDAEPSK